ncbi:MAG: hypothetical protein OJF59_000158 [Cytophagales bacterium]|nr:MAG: hypothetical protein OJF59_000158 [Cytophagales bacterium]
MRTGILFLVFIWAGEYMALSQSFKIDSLQEILKKSKGKERVNVLIELADELSSFDYSRSADATKDAYGLAKQLQYVEGMAKADLIFGTIELAKNNTVLATKSFRECLSLSEQSANKNLKEIALIYIGLSYRLTDLPDSAEVYYARAYQILKDSTSPKHLSILYLVRAKQYTLQSNRPQQLQYLQRSWEIAKRLNDIRLWTQIGRDLAVFYTEQGDYAKTISILDNVQSALRQDTINNEEISLINKERAIVYANTGNYIKALYLFNKTKKYYEQNPFKLELVNLFTDMGMLLSDMSNYEISLKYFLKGISIAEEQHFYSKSALLYARIAWTYYLMEQDQLSTNFCFKALKAAEGKYLKEEASALNVLGLLATRKKEYKPALNYLERALAIRQKNNFQAATASTLLNIGILYEQMGDFKNAEKYDLESLKIDEKLNFAVDLSYSYQSLGQLYTKMKKYDKAQYFLNEAESLAKKINALDIVRDVYKNKRDLLSAQARYADALHYSILHITLHDSLFNKNVFNRMVAMQYDFELEQKDKEITFLSQQQKLQQAELELQHAQIRQQRFVIEVGLIIFVSLSLLAGTIYLYYRKVKKLNLEIQEQNEEITTQSEELIETNETLSKLNQAISEQKEEIQAQAEELTESNQTISQINVGLEEKVKERTAKLKAAYNELDTFFYRSSHDFRRPLTTFMGLAEVANVTLKDQPQALELFDKVNETARNLDKMLLKLQSVSVAGLQEQVFMEVNVEQIFQRELDNFRDEILENHIQVMTDIKINRPLVSYPVLIKYIIQNLTENSVLFCGTHEPYVKFCAYQTLDETVLEVQDNGQGIERTYLNRVFDMYFRANEKSKGNGLGLYIVKKMADKLGGRVELKSDLGQGTLVKVFLPDGVIG